MTDTPFTQAHAAQLAAVPRVLWHRLEAKIQAETLDAGTQFALRELPPGATDAKYRRNELVAASNVKAESDVFLVDHCWTFDPHIAQQLSSNITLLQRLEAMLPEDYGMDGLTIEIEDTTQTSEKTPTRLDADGNPIHGNDANDDVASQTSAEMDTSDPDYDEQLVSQLMAHCNIHHNEAVELLKRHHWELLDAITHADRRARGIPDDDEEGETEMMRSLREQITRNVHQQQEAVAAAAAVDAASSPQTSGTRRKRAASFSDLSIQQRVTRVLDGIVELRLVGSYQLLIPNAQQPQAADGTIAVDRVEQYFYVPDEVGAGILHSSQPNVRKITFIHNKAPGQAYNPAAMVAFDVFWATKDINEGEPIYRDYTEEITDPEDKEKYVYSLTHHN